MNLARTVELIRTVKQPRLVQRRLSDVLYRQSDRLRVNRLTRRSPAALGKPPSDSWHVQDMRWTEGQVTVAFVGPRNGPASVVVKLPHTPQGIESLRHLRNVQAMLHADPRLSEWRLLVPEPLGEGFTGKQYYSVERSLPGSSAAGAFGQGMDLQVLQLQAAEAITELHRKTSGSVVVDIATLRCWVDEPLEEIRQAVSHLVATPECPDVLERLKVKLHDALKHRKLNVCWIHGDFWPGNVLVDTATGSLTGIVDWDRASARQLPLHDLLHLVFLTRKLHNNRWDDAIIVDALHGRLAWSEQERKLLEMATESLPGVESAGRIMFILYWIRHTANTLHRLPQYRQDAAYLESNIELVLRHVMSGSLGKGYR